MLAQLGPLATGTAELDGLLQIVLRVCDVTASAHKRGMISCNLEPDSVTIDAAGGVHLPEASVPMEHGGTHTGTRDAIAAFNARGAPDAPALDAPSSGDAPARGATSAYMAPEQAWGRHCDFDTRTDVYAIGGILYVILTQTAPHEGGSESGDLALAKGGTIHAPKDVRPQGALPQGLCNIALRALSANPSDRYPSIEVLSQAIGRFRAADPLPQLAA